MTDVLVDNPGANVQPCPGGEDADSEQEFRAHLLQLVPLMNSFSRSLCGNSSLSEDILQEALCKAWEGRESFRSGTNLKAWTFRILRNCYYNHCRRAWRRPPLDDVVADNIEAPPDEQLWAMQLADTIEALDLLPLSQRTALILVALGGASYSDVATFCNCPIGTVKSRVTRARKYVSAALQRAPTPRLRKRVRADVAVDVIAQELAVLQARAKQANSKPTFEPAQS